MSITDWETKTTTCPVCGIRGHGALDASKGQTRGPAPGDISVCFGCVEILVYTENLDLRAATPAELEALGEDLLAELEAARSAVRTVKASKAGS